MDWGLKVRSIVHPPIFEAADESQKGDDTKRVYFIIHKMTFQTDFGEIGENLRFSPLEATPRCLHLFGGGFGGD